MVYRNIETMGTKTVHTMMSNFNLIVHNLLNLTIATFDLKICF